MEDIFSRAKTIRLVLFDVDGVLTDGGLHINDQGHETKVFHSRDGHGMKMLKQGGVEIGIITARCSETVNHRMRDLGITHVYQGQKDKLPAYLGLCEKLGIDASQTAYVGDDVVDLPIMRRAGLAIAVGDAHSLVQEHAHWHTSLPGGRGAAREVCELILKAKGKLDIIYDQYLR